jgi:DNA polymerase
VGDANRFRELLPRGITVAEAISGLIRPCFRAASGKRLCIADFSSIEACGVAWCAGQQDLLDLFASGADVYSDLATKLFGRPVSKANQMEREVGKRAILGCGYGMSARKFAEHVARAGVNLEVAGITAEDVVEGYRDAYPAIAGYKVQHSEFSRREGGVWRDVENAAMAAILTGEVGTAAHCELSRAPAALVIQLPSGRKIRYRNARIEDVVPPYQRQLGLPENPRPAIVYDNPQRGKESTYSGKLVENIVQAICRDLLACGMLACEREGLPVVLHVHDEIVVEVPDRKADSALRRLVEIMSTPPEWAKGFPIAVEGFVTERYWKTPPKGSSVVKARNGRVEA